MSLTHKHSTQYKITNTKEENLVNNTKIKYVNANIVIEPNLCSYHRNMYIVYFLYLWKRYRYIGIDIATGQVL